MLWIVLACFEEGPRGTECIEIDVTYGTWDGEEMDSGSCASEDDYSDCCPDGYAAVGFAPPDGGRILSAIQCCPE